MDKPMYNRGDMTPLQNQLRYRLFCELRDQIIDAKAQGIEPDALSPDYGEELWPQFEHLERLFGSRLDFLVSYYLPAMLYLNQVYNLTPATHV